MQIRMHVCMDEHLRTEALAESNLKKKIIEPSLLQVRMKNTSFLLRESLNKKCSLWLRYLGIAGVTVLWWGMKLLPWVAFVLELVTDFRALANVTQLLVVNGGAATFFLIKGAACIQPCNSSLLVLICLCKLLYLHCFAVFIPVVFPLSMMDITSWSIVVKPLILNLFPLQKMFFTHSTTHMKLFAQGKKERIHCDYRVFLKKKKVSENIQTLLIHLFI